MPTHLNAENRIRRLRRSADLSLRDLAFEIGVDHSTIARWESGAHAVPDDKKAVLADFFGVSRAHLMGWDR